MGIALPILLLLSLAAFCLWQAIRVSRQPDPYEFKKRPSIHQVLTGNTFGYRKTEDGKTILLCGRRPDPEPEPDGFIE